MPIAATLYENIDFGGRSLDVNDGQNIGPLIPMPLGGNASSIYVFGPQWITFWERYRPTPEDQLWVAPPPAGRMWVLNNLHNFPRPHGNNHWGDRIAAVSFEGAPAGDNDDRTIIHPDGTVTVGNFRISSEGVWTLIGAERHKNGFALSLETLK